MVEKLQTEAQEQLQAHKIKFERDLSIQEILNKKFRKAKPADYFMESMDFAGLDKIELKMNDDFYAKHIESGIIVELLFSGKQSLERGLKAFVEWADEIEDNTDSKSSRISLAPDG